jgi:predicted permease
LLLSDALWRTRYGGTRDVIGRTVEIDGAPATIVGVMPAQFTFPGHADLWMPIERADGAPAHATFSVLGRLRDGVTIEQAALEIGALTERLPARTTADPTRLAVRSINERFNGHVTDPAWIAFTIVGVLLVAIACANVANLLLMRSLGRTRELAVRAAIGASRRRLVRQLLAESTLLAALGSLLGLALSALGLRLLLLIIPAGGVPYGGFPFDGRVLLGLIFVCLVTVFAFGLAPALHLSKTDVNDVLKSAGRTGTPPPHARAWMSVFLTLEFGLTVLLVASIGLTVKSYRDAQRAAREHDISHLLTGWVAPPADTYPTPERRRALYTSLRQRLEANPDVTGVAFAAALPFGPRRPAKVLVEGRALNAPVPTLDAVVDGGYFQSLGISLLRGRTFTDEDGRPGHETAIVSKRFGDLYFGATDPIGRRIALAPATPSASAPAWMTIVGLAADVGASAPLQPPPMLYVPFRAAAPATALIMARTRSDPTALAASLRASVRALDPGLPLYRVMTLDRARAEALWMGRVSSAIITTIACIALLLAAVGLGAVTAHAAAQRTAEIGIRIALGARRGQLIWMVLRRSLFHVTAGLALGIPLTFVWERLFVGPGSLTTAPILLFVIGVFAGVAALASLVPARRAIRLDPAAALRQE